MELKYRRLSWWDDQSVIVGQSIRDRSDPVPFHPMHPRFEESLGALKSALQVDVVVAQRLGFNNQITDLNLGGESLLFTGTKVPGFYRTVEETEALVLPRKVGPLGKMAGLVMNADCAIIYFVNRQVFGLVHAPLKSLDPGQQASPVLLTSEDCVREDYQSKRGYPVTFAIADHVRRHYDFDLGETRWYVAFGAGASSYGLNLDNPSSGNFSREVMSRIAPWHGMSIGKKVLKPPRMGWAAVDCAEVIQKQLLESGVPKKNIRVDPIDASSLGLDPAKMRMLGEHGDHYSNIRASAEENALPWKPRNAAFIAIV